MRTVVSVLLLVGVLGGGPLHGYGQALQYGITLGVNRVTIQSPEVDPGQYFAFSGGVVVRQKVLGPASIQAELLLNQKGARIPAEPGGAIDYGAGYLELPLLIHLRMPSARSVTLYGEAGGFGGVKLFERQTPGENINVSFDTQTSFYRRIDAGVIAGVGAMIPIRDRRLNLTVRRAWGLRNVARAVESQPFPEAPFPAEGQTRTWSLSLRLGF